MKPIGSKPSSWLVVTYVLGACWLGLGGCGTQAGALADLDVSELPGGQDPSGQFAKHYRPVNVDVDVQMSSYDLPVDFGTITNFEQVAAHYLKNPTDRQLLERLGFVVTEGGPIDDIVRPYEILRGQDVPIFVTADTLLHLYHIQFDETLKEIEEREFYPDIVKVTEAMLEASEAAYKAYEGDLKEAAKRNVAYFSVALKQFKPEARTPDYVSEWVTWECEQIEKHEGLPAYSTARDSALLRYPEDYSQYKPRGHYTRSEILKKYFRGMMWFGRQTFLLKGHEEYGDILPPAKALIDRDTARIQTLQSALISAAAGSVMADEERTVAEVWNRIYAVTAYYVGLADDLTIYEYREALRDVFGSTVDPKELVREENLAKYMLELAKLRKPAIFSGTGGAGVNVDALEIPRLVTIKQLDDILDHTQGFRFMGQRYIPDSYILGKVVSPAAGYIPGKIPERFTVSYFPDEMVPGFISSIRGFPRGLDVFSVLGSRRASAIIEAETDHEYPKYQEQIEKLRPEFARISQRDWNRNLYWSWLYCLKELAEPRGDGYQTFQRSDAWTDRQLMSALASWASLRHDTILYAKQSYTLRFETTSVHPRPLLPPPPKGLVEPVPEFFARILAMTRMTTSGLEELNVLNGPAGARLRNLEAIIERLYDICKRQVQNEPLTEADNAFLADFPKALQGTIGEVDEKGLKTSLVADVHTDLNSKKCLEEASGYVDYMVVAYKRPEGDIVLAVGPVLSYYEFKQPMNDRLADEQWREMLEGVENPERPKWNASFTALTK